MSLRAIDGPGVHHTDSSWGPNEVCTRVSEQAQQTLSEVRNTTEGKFSSDVAIHDGRLPSVARVVQAAAGITYSVPECEALLAPIAKDIRHLYASCTISRFVGRSELETYTPKYNAILQKLICSPLVGHPLWVLQINQAIGWMTRDGSNIHVLNATRSVIKSISSEHLVRFLQYLTTSPHFPKDPVKGYAELLAYEALEKDTVPSSDPSFVSITAMKKQYLTAKVQELIPLQRNIFLDSMRKYQELPIESHAWFAANDLTPEPILEALWGRIQCLQAESNQPLQVWIKEPSKSSLARVSIQHFRSGLVKQGVFIAEPQCFEQERPIDDFFSQGLYARGTAHDERLIEYLREENLLVYDLPAGTLLRAVTKI